MPSTPKTSYSPKADTYVNIPDSKISSKTGAYVNISEPKGSSSKAGAYVNVDLPSTPKTSSSHKADTYVNIPDPKTSSSPIAGAYVIIDKSQSESESHDQDIYINAHIDDDKVNAPNTPVLGTQRPPLPTPRIGSQTPTHFD